jgi:hypothetical protein
MDGRAEDVPATGLFAGAEGPQPAGTRRRLAITRSAIARHLAGGQRLTRPLPRYRGRADEAIETRCRPTYPAADTAPQPQPCGLLLGCPAAFDRRHRIGSPHERTPAQFEPSHPRHGHLPEPRRRQYLPRRDLRACLDLRGRPPGVAHPAAAHHPRVLRRHLPGLAPPIPCTAGSSCRAPRDTPRARHRQAALRRWHADRVW